MTRKTQHYSKEFRAEAIRTVLEQGLSINVGASLLSIPEGIRDGGIAHDCPTLFHALLKRKLGFATISEMFPSLKTRRFLPVSL